MKTIFRKLFAVTLVTMVLSISVAGTAALASEWGDIDFDDVPSGAFNGEAYTSQWGVTFTRDAAYLPSQETITATTVDTKSDFNGLGLINDEAGFHLNIFTEGDSLVSNGAIRATFSNIYTGGPSPKNMVNFYVGTTDSSSNEYIYVKAYDASGNIVDEASIANPASPVSVGLSTRRNDIDSVVIYSNVPFWIDNFQYDDIGNEDPFAILYASSYTGSAGSPVVFDASASYDRDGDTLTYFWSFDDGVTWMESPDSVYENTWDNAWEGTVILKVVDSDKNENEDTATATVSISAPDIVEATIDVNPDTLNLKSKSNKNAVTAYLELPAGYDIHQIDITTVEMVVNGVTISVQLSPVCYEDCDGDGIVELMVKFNRQAVAEALDGMTGDISVEVYWQLDNGLSFYGYDTIKVINPGK